VSISLSPTMKMKMKRPDHWFLKLYLSAFFAVLCFVVGLILHFKAPRSTAEFFVTTLSLLPISILIQLSSSDILITLRRARQEVLAGVFRTVFGTFSELVLATVSLLRHDGLLAQTSLIGAFLANCLLLLGIAFVVGGVASDEMQYPVLIARASSQLLVVSLASITIPTTFQFWQQRRKETPRSQREITEPL